MYHAIKDVKKLNIDILYRTVYLANKDGCKFVDMQFIAPRFLLREIAQSVANNYLSPGAELERFMTCLHVPLVGIQIPLIVDDRYTTDWREDNGIFHCTGTIYLKGKEDKTYVTISLAGNKRRL